MDELSLRTDGGSIYAWICGKCRHVHVPSERRVPHTNEDIARFAEDSRQRAKKCCTCIHCGAYVELGEHDNDEVVEGQPERYSDSCKACWPAQVEKIIQLHAEYAADREQRRVARKASLKMALDPYAAEALDLLMRDLSESKWCAVWDCELEYTLWEQINGDGFKAGVGHVNAEDMAQLRHLSKKAGGWWTYDEFVLLDRWGLIYADYIAKRTKSEAP